MTTIHPVPNEKQIHQIFAMLFGSDIRLNPNEPVPTDDALSMFAVFINDEGKQVTACVCDHHFTAYAGSALTKIPVDSAEDASKTGKYTPMMLNNLHEIMNICSRLFMNDTSPHLRLDKVFASPDAAREVLDGCQGRVDFTVSIPGYGDGVLSFLCT